jgi:hypothetical protein
VNVTFSRAYSDCMKLLTAIAITLLAAVAIGCGSKNTPSASTASTVPTSQTSTMDQPDSITLEPGQTFDGHRQPAGPLRPVNKRVSLVVRTHPNGRTRQAWFETRINCDVTDRDRDWRCEAALALPVEAYRPVPRGQICTEIYGGPELGQVKGEIDGQKVDADFERVNGCENDRWNRIIVPLTATR